MTKFTKLIRMIYEQGCCSGVGRNAVGELANGGEAALDAFLRCQHDPPQSDIHPRDLSDTISCVFGEFARQVPDALLDRFERGDIDEFCTYWAPGAAKGERPIDVLIAGLKSKDQYSRWAAAESLIRRKSVRATSALIEALRDRSSLVKSAIVQAMKSNQSVRRPEAIPALRRIIASKSVRKHSPGILKHAEEVVRLIELET